jgi:hypothetical protein
MAKIADGPSLFDDVLRVFPDAVEVKSFPDDEVEILSPKEINELCLLYIREIIELHGERGILTNKERDRLRELDSRRQDEGLLKDEVWNTALSDPEMRKSRDTHKAVFQKLTGITRRLYNNYKEELAFLIIDRRLNAATGLGNMSGEAINRLRELSDLRLLDLISEKELIDEVILVNVDIRAEFEKACNIEHQIIDNNSTEH